MFESVWAYAARNPLHVWYLLFVVLAVYWLLWPPVKRFLAQRAQSRARYDYADDVRLARLKQADALRDATRMARL
jgi:hypothetical protein